MSREEIVEELIAEGGERRSKEHKLSSLQSSSGEYWKKVPGSTGVFIHCPWENGRFFKTLLEFRKYLASHFRESIHENINLINVIFGLDAICLFGLFALKPGHLYAALPNPPQSKYNWLLKEGECSVMNTTLMSDSDYRVVGYNLLTIWIHSIH